MQQRCYMRSIKQRRSYQGKTDNIWQQPGKVRYDLWFVNVIEHSVLNTGRPRSQNTFPQILSPTFCQNWKKRVTVQFWKRGGSQSWAGVCWLTCARQFDGLRDLSMKTQPKTCIPVPFHLSEVRFFLKSIWSHLRNCRLQFRFIWFVEGYLTYFPVSWSC